MTRPRRAPRTNYGRGHLTAVMLVLNSGLPLPEQVDRFVEMFAGMSQHRGVVSTFAANADAALAVGDTARAEHIAHAFIHTALAVAPPLPPPLPRWRRWATRLRIWIGTA